MNIELQERVERVTEELKEALIPLRNEINKMKSSSNKAEDIKSSKKTHFFQI